MLSHKSGIAVKHTSLQSLRKLFMTLASCSKITLHTEVTSCTVTIEGSAPRGVAASWSAMACAGNAIPGRVPQPRNPVVQLGEDSRRPKLASPGLL